MQLHIDLRGNSEVQDLRDHVGGLKIKQHIGKFLCKCPPQRFDVVRRRRMPIVERDQDLPVVHTDCGSIHESEIIDARGKADIIENEAKIAPGDLAPDLVLDVLEILLGALDPGSRRRADM